MMNDNKHYIATKQSGLWDFVYRDPGDYVGRHRICDTIWHRRNHSVRVNDKRSVIWYRTNTCSKED